MATREAYMQFKTVCPSPLGDMLLASDGAALTGLWFVGQAYCAAGLPADAADAPELPVFELVQAWLESYFAGEMSKVCAGASAGPGLRPPASELLRLELLGTPFQRMVWEALQSISYGETTTYGKLAQSIKERRGTPTSARAVGAAVGRNPVSLIVPCHRVTGADGSLTGYAGGLWRKRALLALERQGITVGEEQRPSSELVARLLDIWEGSVRATHAFLVEADIQRLRGMVPQAIAEVPHLLVARRGGAPVGFAGTDGAFLEMLFVADDARGSGVGRLLLERATELLGVTELSVNEQNPQAIGFYEHMGFVTYRRTDTDTQGDPFPLLYMKRADA